MADDATNFFRAFVSILGERYSSHLTALRSAGAKGAVRASPKPVMSSRQCIIDAYRLATTGKIESARGKINQARSHADSGSVNPDRSEWPIDGIEIGRAHACMWGAIARVLTRTQASRWDVVDAERSDSWFGVAALQFCLKSELKMMGRTLQEWAESRRMTGDVSGSKPLLLAAATAFAGCDENDRARLALERLDAAGPIPIDSPFLLGRSATASEAGKLGTLLGSKNVESLYQSLH